MTEVIGIDHIYIAVSDMARAEAFYDRVLGDVPDGYHGRPPRSAWLRPS